MRICFLTQEDIVIPPGGTGTYVRSIATYLAARGHDVHVVSRRLSGQPAEEQFDGVHIHRVWAPGPAVLYSPMFFKRSARRVSNLESASPFQIIHGNLPLLSSLGYSASAGQRHVETVHSSLAGLVGTTDHRPLSALNWNEAALRVLRPVIARAERHTLKRATQVISVSEGLVDEIERAMPGVSAKVHVIPNGVDTERFRPAVAKAPLRRQLSLGIDDVIVLYLGRLMEGKRVIDLVRAMPAVRDAVPQVRLVIAGRPTSYLRSVLAEAVSLGVADATISLGHVPYAEVPDLIGAADCYVLPSSYEGFPFTTLEAMSCGVPVVGTKVAGIIDQIQDGETGLLVPVGRPDLLADAIIRVLFDRGLAARLAGNGRRRVETFYAWRAIGAQHELLLEAILR